MELKPEKMQLHSQDLHSHPHSMEAYSCAMAASAASSAAASSSAAAAAVAAAVAAAELQQNIRKFKCEPQEPEGGASGSSALDELNKMDDCLVTKSMGHKLKYGKYSPADDGCLYSKPHPATVNSASGFRNFFF